MPRVFVSPELSLAIDPALFELLFGTFGYPASLRAPAALGKVAPRKTPPLDAQAVARALFGGEASRDLAAAMPLVAMLGHPAGRDALCEGARDARQQGHFEDGVIDRALDAVGAPVAKWASMPPVDLAVRLVVARHRDASGEALEPLFERAQHRLARALPSRIPYELAARTAAIAPPREETVGIVLRDAARAESPATTWADAWTTRDDDGAVLVAVLRSAAPEATCVFDATSARRVVQQVLAVDLVRVELAREGPVRIRAFVTTARPQLAFAYAAAIGSVTCGDDDALVERPALTLKKLQLLGQSGFQKLAMPRPVVRVEIIALQHDDLRGLRVEARGERPLLALEPRLRRGGYLSRATFRFEIEGAPHPVDAYLELPHRLSVSDPRFEREVHAALAVLGVFSPGAYGDDLTTTAPWVHPEWRWRELVGAKVFEALVRARLLVRAPAKGRVTRIARAEDRRLAGNLRGFPLRNARDKGRYYAVAADLAVRARSAVGHDVSMWKLDMTARRERRRAAMGLDAGEKIALPKGVRDVGRLELTHDGGATIRFVELVRAVGDAETKKLARLIRLAVGRDHAVVLVPEGKTLGGMLAEVPLDLAQQLGLGDYSGVVVRAAKELGVEAKLEPWRFGSKASPMVIVKATEEVWLGRVRLALTAKHVIGFEALAGGAAKTGAELGELMSPTATDLAHVFHKVKSELQERLERSFRDAGVPLPREWCVDQLVVKAGNRSFKLGVGCVVR